MCQRVDQHFADLLSVQFRATSLHFAVLHFRPILNVSRSFGTGISSLCKIRFNAQGKFLFCELLFPLSNA